MRWWSYRSVRRRLVHGRRRSGAGLLSAGGTRGGTAAGCSAMSLYAGKCMIAWKSRSITCARFRTGGTSTRDAR
jgi:hypothetical protein